MLKSVLATSLVALAGAAAAERPLAIAPTSAAIKWGPCPPLFARGCQIAVLRGDPAKPNADVLLRVPPGFRLPPHRHTSAERMVLVGGRLRVRYQGSPPTLLTAGTYAYGPAGLAHEGSCLGPQRCTLFIAFEGPVDAVAVQGPIR
jgi:quercetin dioxygenase-like cupin family protein